MKELKELKRRLKNYITWLWNSYVWNPLHFRYMKNKAIRMHKITRKRYFVVPKTETSLTIVDNNYINFYNKQKGVKKININDLIRMAYYATPAKGITQ